MYDALHGKKCPEAVSKALDIFEHEYKRETLEATLLCGMTEKEIEQLLRVPAQVVQTYKTLFFDTSVFETRLDIIDYAHTYSDSKFGSELKQFAVDLGKECLQVRLADNSTYDIPTQKIVESIRKIAFLSVNMVRASRINPELANFAQRWANLGLKAADVKVAESNNALETLRLALATVPHEQPDIDPEQIMH